MTDAQPPNVITLSRFRADIARAFERRGKRLLEAADLAERVPALAPLEAYFIVKELGVADAGPILRHVSGEQLRVFVDLDCWQGDRPDAAEIDAWLAPFASLGKEALALAFLCLDSELQVVFLGESLQIHDARDGEPPELGPDTPRWTTPDQFFIVDALEVDRREVHPFHLIEALYAHDLHEAFRLLTAVRWELKSPQEEEAYRLRCGRMEDLGFPSRQAALALFAPPTAAATGSAPATEVTSLPALYADALVDASLFSRALGRVDDVALLRRLESGFVYLVNAAVVAYGEQPRDLAHVIEIAGRVRDTLSLGLEIEAGSDDQGAAQHLRRRPLGELFRVGHAEVMKLARTAAALAARPEVATWLERDGGDHDPDHVDRAFLRALTAARPLHAGFDALAPGRNQAFATRGELSDATARLAALGRRFR